MLANHLHSYVMSLWRACDSAPLIRMRKQDGMYTLTVRSGQAWHFRPGYHTYKHFCAQVIYQSYSSFGISELSRTTCGSLELVFFLLVTIHTLERHTHTHTCVCHKVLRPQLQVTDWHHFHLSHYCKICQFWIIFT